MVSDILLATLVVDDDGSVIGMPRFSLHSAGFDTSEVTAGGGTLHILAEQPPHAAALDWLQQVGERTKSSPIWVVMSAPEGEKATKRDGRSGSHFLARPFGSLDLIAMLEQLLLATDGPY
jgi:CheY-like chemotaxis protein